MFDNIENLKIISIQQNANKPYTKVENRKNHSFIFRTRGSQLYDFGDKKIPADEGSLMFLPKGATYEATRISDEARYMSVIFEADFAESPCPRCYSLDKFLEAEYMMRNLSDMYHFGTPADRHLCMSLLYRLLSHLSAEENACYDMEKFNRIEPAVEYLRKHLYDCALRVDRLHRLCGISTTYFRQVFFSRFGTTPQNYILSKRLSHARSILMGGDFDAISEVALSVGFCDPLYFSKAYKKEYGMSPSEACREGQK